MHQIVRMIFAAKAGRVPSGAAVPYGQFEKLPFARRVSTCDDV